MNLFKKHPRREVSRLHKFVFTMNDTRNNLKVETGIAPNMSELLRMIGFNWVYTNGRYYEVTDRFNFTGRYIEYMYDETIYEEVI